jgi:protein arginine kinase activator
MKCEICNEKEATLFYEETVNGKHRSFHLCRACAEQLRAEGKLKAGLPEEGTALSYPDLLGELFGLPRRREAAEAGKRCPDCGSSLQELAAAGKAFCPGCYAAFEKELLGSIRSVHGNVTHTGRAPAARRARDEKRNRINELKAALKTAIEAEDFEKAAELRDEIRSLEA